MDQKTQNMEYDYLSGDETEPYDDECCDSDVETVILEPTENMMERKNNESHDEEDETDDGMGINTCCFCGDEIRWESQSCGACARGISSYGFSFGPSVLPDHLHRVVHADAKENVVRNISYPGANPDRLLTESEFRDIMNNATCFQESYNALTDPIETLLEIAGATMTR